MQVVKENAVLGLTKQLGDDVISIDSRDNWINSKVRIIITKLDNNSLSELLELLNSINGQGIKSINRTLLTYSNSSCENIDILDMCTAEKLFLLAFLAKKGYFKLVLDESLLGFEKTLYKRFLKIFKNDDIYIICDDMSSKVIERWMTE